MRNLTTLPARAPLLLPRLATAQTPTPAPVPTASFGEQVEVTEVLLDAQVTDRDGNVIVGLGKDDFRVEEDGKPVELTNVEFYSSRARLDTPPQANKPVLSQRYYVLFIHDQRHLDSDVPGVLSRQLDAGRRAREWVAKLSTEDYVAVASFNTSLVIDADFTRDRAVLQRAVDEAVRGGEPAGNWPSRLPPEGGPSLLRN